MALITCRDCGRQISSAAKACPECGRPAPQSIKRLAIIGSITFAVFVIFFMEPLTSYLMRRAVVDESAKLARERGGAPAGQRPGTDPPRISGR